MSNTKRIYCKRCGILMARLKDDPSKQRRLKGQSGLRPRSRNSYKAPKQSTIKRRPRRRPKRPRDGQQQLEDTEKNESKESQAPAYMVVLLREMKRLGRRPNSTFMRRFCSFYVQVPSIEVKIKKETVEEKPQPQQEPQPPEKEQKIQPQLEAERQQRATPALPMLEGEPNLFASTQNSVIQIKEEDGIGKSY